MSARLVHCAKLKQELPAIDPDTPEGARALKMALLIGGPELRQRISDSVSAQAWNLWTDYMRLVINEYQLDATSDSANEVLRPHMEAFFFGEQKPIPGYRPPEQ